MRADRILPAAKAVIASDPDGGHSANDVTCPACQAFWKHLEATDAHDTDAVARLAADLPDAPCPSDTCIPCDGCRLELDIAMTTIALGSAGVDADLAWGPGHSTGDLHEPDQWADCRACTAWTRERAAARTALTDAGIDADRWLGTDDQPH